MKLTFLGTRGCIEACSGRHRRHASLLVTYRSRQVMVDCGEDWLEELDGLRPPAIVLTHAHPDHAFGLKKGAPCPVYATETTWERLAGFPVADRRILEPRRPLTIGGITFEAFAVEHSLRAPAVGYRISAGRATVFYAPDLVHIPQRAEALREARLYIGDGASVARSLVRRQDGRLFGHTTVRTQLTWCRQEGVPKMIVTHCGSGLVVEEERETATLRAFAAERKVKVTVAHDGLVRILR